MPFSDTPFSALGSGFALIKGLATIVLAVFVWRGRTRFVTGTAVVLTGFEIGNTGGDRPVIEIWGRLAGLMSWVLTALGLEPEFNLRVTSSSLSIRSASLGGTSHTFIPLNAVKTSVCGYQRSILAFGFAVWFGLGAVLDLLSGILSAGSQLGSTAMSMAFAELVLGGIAALIYYLSKRIGISVESMHTHGITFKPGLIGGYKTIDLPQALQVIETLNQLVLSARQTPYQGAPNTPAVGITCAKCSSPNPPGLRFCESCGTALA